MTCYKCLGLAWMAWMKGLEGRIGIVGRLKEGGGSWKKGVNCNPPRCRQWWREPHRLKIKQSHFGGFFSIYWEVGHLASGFLRVYSVSTQAAIILMSSIVFQQYLGCVLCSFFWWLFSIILYISFWSPDLQDLMYKDVGTLSSFVISTILTYHSNDLSWYDCLRWSNSTNSYPLAHFATILNILLLLSTAFKLFLWRGLQFSNCGINCSKYMFMVR